jgi:carboxymethylenebutenolidase
MKDRICIKGRDGAFNAYIAHPKTLPAPIVVVLQELFGVNADIRKHCDELAEQGFLAVAPDLFCSIASGAIDPGIRPIPPHSRRSVCQRVGVAQDRA